MFAAAAYGCRTFFSRLDEYTELFPGVQKTSAANAGAFENPAVLDF